MVLSTLALFCDQPTKLINIASWKEKETDRIAAVVQGLERLGVLVSGGDDAITIILFPISRALKFKHSMIIELL